MDIGSADEDVKTYIHALKSASDARIHALEQQVALLLEELSLARHKRFGRSSEHEPIGPSLPFFFDELREQNQSASVIETVTVAEHERKKSGRKKLDPELPRVETVIDISDADKICACGAHLVRIGAETCEKLHHIPEKYFVEVIVRPYYACKKCEGFEDQSKSPVRVAPVPPAIIPKGFATADLLASIAVNKFCDHLPFYRQEQRLSRLGVSISRTDMANWMIKAGTTVLPLLDMLHERQKQGDVINMDETPVTVMGEEGKANSAKSYMWLMRGGPPGAPCITYHYRVSRGAAEARSLLEGFSGYLQTDGYDSYPAAIAGTPIVHVGCWAHARRRFFDAAKASPESGIGVNGVAWIKKLYAIERVLRRSRDEGKISAQDFKRRRIKEVSPVLNDFHAWLLGESEKVLPSSLAGKAVSYTLGQWQALSRYIEHADLTPDNNAAENAIRPFVLGRKNWMICGSPDGAKYACLFYSLIETAKANGLNPFDYLMMLFYFAPRATNEQDWIRLLPLKGMYNPPGPVSIPVPPGLF
jgi:transposase